MTSEATVDAVDTVDTVEPGEQAPELVSLVDLATEVGITYRQADYWIRAGYIDAESYTHGGRRPAPVSKSGTVRRLTPTQADVLQVMGRLVKAGLPVHQAAEIAHEQTYSARTEHTLADGIYLTVIDPHHLLDAGARRVETVDTGGLT